MKILSGPPGSDLITPVVDAFRNTPGSWLIVPTATLGEHLRNRLARDGEVVRPSSITTFAKLINAWTEDVQAATPLHVEWLTSELLDSPEMRDLAHLRGFPGFRRALANAVEELSSAGSTSEDLRALEDGSEFHRSLRRFVALVEAACVSCGWTPRRDLLLAAAARAAQDPRVPAQLFFAGFYSFTPGELAVIKALHHRSALTISLPQWSGGDPALTAFRALGATESVVELRDSAATTTVVAAPTHDTEAEEIARRILDLHSGGANFRDMGIVVRSEDPYVPILKSALDRFGIPARFYFGASLASHAVTNFLGGLVEAMLEAWDHATLLRALRTEGSPLAFADRFEFDLVKRLPGGGLDDLAHRLPAEALERLEQIDSWRNSAQAPERWAEQLGSLISFYATPPLQELSRTEALLWRERAAALEAWVEAAQQAGQLLGSERVVPIERFWRAMTVVLESSEIRVADHRRDVVHVIDAFEARQWRLPIVFACGMYERHFPHYSNENPILDDATRLALRDQGVHLRTTAERQQDERLLFDVVCRHATQRLILSYPKLDAKGNDRLRSFFLRDFGPPESAFAVHPTPQYFGRTQRHGISDEQLLASLTGHLASISVSNIDAYLQCPFVFFTRRTLALQEPPEDPEKRFNFRLRGTLAHNVLERVYREGLPLDDAFDMEFDALQQTERLIPSYRTEGLRLGVYHDVRRFLDEGALTPRSGTLYEEEVEIDLDGVVLKGRADRVDFDEQGRAIVIDYKYKMPTGIRALNDAHQSGRNVQAGLYLRAMRKKYDVAGMVFAGLRGETSYAGWVLAGSSGVPGLTEVSSRYLEEDIQKAYTAALDTITAVRHGRTQPEPAKEDECRWCVASPVCRVEEKQLIAIGGVHS